MAPSARAAFGSASRFIGVLTEHFAGAFPLWLAPVQVTVLSISEKSAEYAVAVQEQLKAAGLRATTGVGPEKIGAKIREASIAKIPYLLVVGEQEAAAGTVAVHPRAGAESKMAVADFVARATAEVAERSAGAAATAVTPPADAPTVVA